MGIIFTKQPTFYDWNGTPTYISQCGKYRLVHLRVGAVRKGKAEKENWFAQFRKSAKREDWERIYPTCETKQEVKRIARLHARLLAVQVAIDKQERKKNDT